MDVDFGEAWTVLGGAARKVKFLVATLPASNVYFAKPYRVEPANSVLRPLFSPFVWCRDVSSSNVGTCYRRAESPHEGDDRTARNLTLLDETPVVTSTVSPTRWAPTASRR